MEGGRVLEEVQYHRGRVTPSIQMDHYYLFKAAVTPNSHVELNLLYLLNEYNKNSSTVDTSAANVNTIVRLVTETPQLETTPHPPHRLVWVSSLFHRLIRCSKRRPVPTHWLVIVSYAGVCSQGIRYLQDQQLWPLVGVIWELVGERHWHGEDSGGVIIIDIPLLWQIVWGRGGGYLPEQPWMMMMVPTMSQSITLYQRRRRGRCHTFP